MIGPGNILQSFKEKINERSVLKLSIKLTEQRNELLEVLNLLESIKAGNLSQEALERAIEHRQDSICELLEIERVTP